MRVDQLDIGDQLNRPRLRLRARQLQWRVMRKASRIFGVDRTIYVDARIEEYRGYWSGAAALLGARFEALTDAIWEIGRDGRKARASGHLVSIDDPVTLRLAGDKPYCHTLAKRLGIPTPEYHVLVCDAIRAAQEIVKSDRGPWVIKPAASSSSGLGVTTGITRVRQVASAMALASLYCEQILLERMIAGESCRLLFLNGDLLSAVRRRGARVIADGRSTVRSLADSAGLGRAVRDPIVRQTLANQKLHLDTTPIAGCQVVLHGTRKSERNAELRTIYDEAVTNLIHPDTTRQLSMLVQRLGSRFAGVDIVTVDPAVPLEQNRGAFLEVNTTPGIHHHYQSAEDHEHHGVAVAVLRAMLGVDRDDMAAERTTTERGARRCNSPVILA